MSENKQSIRDRLQADGCSRDITGHDIMDIARFSEDTRQIHSIQTEGHFGDIKENENFRRFSYRSTEKVFKKIFII